MMGNNHGLYRVHELDDIFISLSKNHGKSRREIMGILKRTGCQHRTTRCRWYGTRTAVNAARKDPESLEAGTRDSWENEFN